MSFTSHKTRHSKIYLGFAAQAGPVHMNLPDQLYRNFETRNQLFANLVGEVSLASLGGGPQVQAAFSTSFVHARLRML